MPDRPFFFFSYAHQDKCNPLNVFLEDLKEELRDIWEGDAVPEPIFFRDEEGIPTGGVWKEELKEALCKSHTMLSLISNSYFRSEYCGKEFRVFLERNPEVAVVDGRIQNSRHILPVLWVAKVDANIPEVVQELNYAQIADDNTSLKSYLRSNIRHDSYNRPKEYLDSITTLARQIKHLVENDPLTVFPLDEMQELDQVKSFFHEYEDVVPAETTDNDAAAPTLERHMQGPDSWVVIYPWLPDAELQYRDWRPFEEQPYLYDLFMQQGAAARIHIHQTAVDITDEQQKTMLDQALEQATESNTLFSIVLNPDWFSDARYTPFVLQLMQKPWSGNLVIPDAEEDQQAWIAPLQAMATDRVVISEMPPGTVEQHRTQLDLMINGQQERMLKFGQVHQIAEGVGPLRKPNVQGPQIQNNPLSA